MPWGTSASNTLKINKITIISFFTLCRNTTISFHNFVELIPVFKIYLYLCRIDYSLNNIITMKKRHYGMLSLALTSCLAVHAENKNQNTDKPNVIFIYADDLGYGDLECYGAKNVQKLQMSTVWHPKGYDLSTHTLPPLPVPHPDIPC